MTARTPPIARTQRSSGRASWASKGPDSVTCPPPTNTSMACGCDTTRPSSERTRPTRTSSGTSSWTKSRRVPAIRPSTRWRVSRTVTSRAWFSTLPA